MVLSACMVHGDDGWLSCITISSENTFIWVVVRRWSCRFACSGQVISIYAVPGQFAARGLNVELRI